MLRWLPGSPIDTLLGDELVASYSETELLVLKEELGLAGSLWQQFISYMGGLIQGNLGYSSFHNAPVTEVLAQALPWTLLLLCCSIPLSLGLGASLGLIAGSQRGKRIDQYTGAIAALLSSIPSFAIALLLLSIFAIHLDWFPLSGATSLFSASLNPILDTAWHAALPVLALSLHGSVRYFYLARGLAISLNQRPFVIAAKMRGISTWYLLRDYYGRNALTGLLAKLSNSIPMTMGAALFIEVVFSYPGLGHLLLDAIQMRDYPTVQGGLFVLALLILFINSSLDLIIAALGKRG